MSTKERNRTQTTKQLGRYVFQCVSLMMQGKEQNVKKNSRGNNAYLGDRAILTQQDNTREWKHLITGYCLVVHNLWWGRKNTRFQGRSFRIQISISPPILNLGKLQDFYDLICFAIRGKIDALQSEDEMRTKTKFLAWCLEHERD